jgi:hypothetical protein
MEALYVREGVADVPMLVRSDGEPLGEDAMARARADVLLLARLRHDHVLRVEFVTAVEGRIGQVFEHSGGAALEWVLAAERAAGRAVPLRVVVEIAAGVAAALDEAGGLTQGGSRVDHPGPDFGSVLLERSGRSKLAGFVVTTGAVARRPGYDAPEGGGGAAVLTWMSAQFLVELLRVCGLDGELPEDLAAVISAARVVDPSSRTAPGAFARALRAIAANLSGASVRGWAEAPVRAAFEAARLARSGASAGRSLDPASANLMDFPTEESPGGPPTLHPGELVDLETSDHGLGRGDSPWSGLGPLPVRVGPSAPPPSDPPVRPALGMPSPMGAPRPEPTVSLGVRGERVGPAGPRRVEPFDAAPNLVGPVLLGPALAGPALAGPALAGPALAGPAAPRVDLAMGGVGLDLPEPDAPPPSRSGLYAGLALVGVLSVLGVAMASAAVYWYAGPAAAPAVLDVAEPELAVPVEAAPVPTTGADAPVAVAPAPSPSEARPAAPSSATPVAPPQAPKPAPPPSVTPAAPTPAAPAPAAPAPSDADDDAARIVAGMRSAAPPAAPPAPAAVVAPAPALDDPGPFDISFKPAEGGVSSLEVRCAAQSGSGMIIELNQVPKGTSCKITGLGGAAPLQTLVTVTSARSYSCFANGSRSCR